MAVSNKGFTLIEVMVALTFLALTLAAFASLLIGTMRLNAQARQITAATNLAQEKLEALRTTANPADGGPEDLTETGEPGGPYAREWDVETGTPTDTSRTVTVTVRWSTPHERSVRLQTILAR